MPSGAACRPPIRSKARAADPHRDQSQVGRAPSPLVPKRERAVEYVVPTLSGLLTGSVTTGPDAAPFRTDGRPCMAGRRGVAAPHPATQVGGHARCERELMRALTPRFGTRGASRAWATAVRGPAHRLWAPSGVRRRSGRAGGATGQAKCVALGSTRPGHRPRGPTCGTTCARGSLGRGHSSDRQH
jgi:hypothetical protein